MDNGKEIMSLLKHNNQIFEDFLKEMREMDLASIMPFLNTSMDDIMAEPSHDGKEITFTVRIENKGNAAAINPHVKLVKYDNDGPVIATKSGDVPKYREIVSIDTAILSRGDKAEFQAAVNVDEMQYHNFIFCVGFSDMRGQAYGQWFQITYSFDENGVHLGRRVVETPFKDAQ